MPPFIPEIRRDNLVSTHLRVLAVIDHRLQTLALRGDATALRAAGWLEAAAFISFTGGVSSNAEGDAVALLARVEEDAGGGFAVAAGAPGFLDELLERAGEAVVCDEADVWGVDAHAESGGGGDDVEGSCEGEGFI